MGKPVHMVRLAENLIRMYGKVPYQDVEIKFTGLRPGEKLREELLMDEEGLQKTSNKLIFIGRQIELDSEKFIRQLRKLRNAAMISSGIITATGMLKLLKFNCRMKIRLFRTLNMIIQKNDKKGPGIQLLA